MELARRWMDEQAKRENLLSLVEKEREEKREKDNDTTSATITTAIKKDAATVG